MIGWVALALALAHLGMSLRVAVSVYRLDRATGSEPEPALLVAMVTFVIWPIPALQKHGLIP